MMSINFQIRLKAVVAIMLLCAVAVVAQVQTKNCRGPVYEAKDVAIRAKLTTLPDFHVLYGALGAGVEAHVAVDAVLCRDGSVTDFKVTKSEPPNAAEFVVAALSIMPFKPAESNWHTVSQRQKFDLTFNQHGVSGIDLATAPPEGLTVKGSPRLTEEIDIIGNRRLTKDEILAWIKTRPGDPYDPDQVKQDLQAVLKTGWFNKIGTRVTVEDGVRGGVRVSFEVVELPLIAEIRFEGSAGLINQSAILNEFARQHVDIAWGRPFDPANSKKATRVIEDYFRSQGWINAKAESFVENSTATDVKITFKITGTNF